MLLGLHGRGIRIASALVLASLLWLSVRLVQRYQTTIEVPVRYVNLPSTLKLSQALPTAFKVRLNGIGHQLLLPTMNLLRDTLALDLTTAVKSGYMPLQELQQQLADYLPPAVQIEQVRPDTVRVAFEEKIYKRVPIVSALQVNATQGYMLTDPPRFAPDSVTLLGTRADLAEIVQWPTAAEQIGELEGTREFTVALAASAQIGVQPTTVQARATAEKYTEASVAVRLHVINLPYNRVVRLLPEVVQLRFMVPFARYEQVSDAAFDLAVDYAQLDPTASFAFPLVLRKPDFVRGLQLEPAYVRFVITHRE